MNEFQLLYPPIIRFAWGARHQLGEVASQLAPSPSYMLVTGSSSHYSAIRDDIAAQLGAACAHFTDVKPDPVLTNVEALLALLRQHKPALVIAAGGGSVIDVAKAAATIAPTPYAVGEYFNGQRDVAEAGIPLIALPTTAGTGAEITKNAVLTEPETQTKKSIRHPLMVAKAAIIDPELTLTVRPQVTAASGLDALTQAIESYISNKAHHASQALARQAIVLLMGALEQAYTNGNDREAREAVAEGSLLSAMAFSQSGLGAVHGLAHPLGTLLSLRHGFTCAVLLPHILRYNAPAVQNELTALAAAVNVASADDFVTQVETLSTRLEIPRHFAEQGLNEEHFPFIVANCRSNSMRGNPRPMSDEAVVELLATLAG